LDPNDICSGTVLSDGSCCLALASGDRVRANVSTLDLSTLGLTPPFQIEGP
jgi:hypothetical protein